MKKIHGKFRCTSDLCDVHYYFYIPKKPKAAVIMSHGMCEYVERYKEFAAFLCDNDIAFCGCDQLGHGRSVAGELHGWFGEKNGHLAMVKNLHRMKLIAEKKLPDIPHFLIGHSMGSFIARIYLAKYADRLDGAILMGTAGPVPWVGALHSYLSAASADSENGKKRYEWGMDFAMGVFNLRSQNRRTQYDWLSRDDKNVDRFIDDSFCNFDFTMAGCRDLVGLLMLCNSKEVICGTRTDIPLLFLSGGMDPVGEFGTGVRRAQRLYEKRGCDTTLRIYREARHELLNELNKEEVYTDILSFMINRI